MTDTNNPPTPPPAAAPRSRYARWPWLVVLILCVLHTAGAWFSMGGWADLTGPRPIAIHDHGVQQHNAWVARPMLLQKGLAGGYDPYFMAGYPKSLLSSPSSTVFEVANFLNGGRAPAVAYKVVVFIALASLPWLVAWAAGILRLGAGTAACAVGLFLVYVWTDGGGGGYPLNYALFGTTAYLLSVPLGLVVTAALVRFLTRGGLFRWLGLAGSAWACFLVHVTSVLFLVPAGIVCFLASVGQTRTRGLKRFTAIELAALLAVSLNAFWWLPAVWLRETRAPALAFLTNSNESVIDRMARIPVSEQPIEAVLLGLGSIGLVALSRKDRLAAAGLGGFAAAGLFFGYLAAWFPSLDFLQPGRQTHALFSAEAVLAAVAIVELVNGLNSPGSTRMRVVAILGLALIAGRLFGRDLVMSARYRMGLLPGVATRPFLSSLPPPEFEAIIGWIRDSTKPGDRIFYEEVGRDLTGGDPDPFAGGRYSGLLPQMTGVEVIGGFYLHIGLKTNFTQIGEGKLFGADGWDRERFIRYAKLYRPSAIICWSAAAKQFCRENKDLVTITFRHGRILAGEVTGFEGDAIRGQATIHGEAGRLRVSGLVPDLDGLVILRYHHAPGMRCVPPMRLEPILLEEDPVPFIGLRPAPGQSDAHLDLAFPIGR